MWQLLTDEQFLNLMKQVRGFEENDSKEDACLIQRVYGWNGGYPIIMLSVWKWKWPEGSLKPSVSSKSSPEGWWSDNLGLPSELLQPYAEMIMEVAT